MSEITMNSAAGVRGAVRILLVIGMLLAPFSGGVFAVDVTSLPAELAPLEQQAANEEAMVKWLHEYDVQQREALKKFQEACIYANVSKTPVTIPEMDSKRTISLLRTGYEYALMRYQHNPLLHNYYGEILYDYYNELPAGIQEWTKALSLDDNFAPAHNNLGIHYCHTGAYALGLQHLDRALELDKNNPDYLFNMAQIYMVHFPQVMKEREWSKKKVYKEVMKLSKRAAENAPDDFELAYDYALNFFAAENFDVTADWHDAAKAWQRVRTLTTRPDQVFNSWMNEARAWIQVKDKSKALQCLDEAEKIAPNQETIGMLRAMVNKK